jgi:hypothetical protein
MTLLKDERDRSQSLYLREYGGNIESVIFSIYLIKQYDAARTVYFDTNSESISPTTT